jgi:hypothetical protein
MIGSAIDLWMVYAFIKRLITPFSEWEAYKLGIIDERGNVLKKRKELRLQAEVRAFGVFDVLVLNLKKLLEKLPAGQTRLASYAAALWLIREHKAFTPESTLTEDLSDELLVEAASLFFSSYTDYTRLDESVNHKNSIDAMFEEKFLKDDAVVAAPTNNVGSGAIAGMGVGPDGEPGVTRAQQRRHQKRTTKGKKLRDVIGMVP